jgi:hypothetical protein
MATIYPSALINRIKGRLGEVVYTQVFGRQVAKLFPTTFSHPATFRTAQIRANISEIARSWDALSIPEKTLWQSRAVKSHLPRVGFHEFMSLNSTLLHASHVDLTMIFHPPSTPATPRAVRNFSFYQTGTYSMCLFWSKPLNTIDYVQAYFRLNRDFCALNPCFGLCTTVGYRPCWRFIETVRSDAGHIDYNFSWPPGTRLFFRSYSVDKFGRHSPFTYSQYITTQIIP